jgi:hypothetical protein
MNTFLIITAYAELFVWITAFLLFFLQSGNSFAESASYAIVSSLMVLSFIFQITFIIGIPSASFFLEAILTIGSAAMLFTLRSQFKRVWEILKFLFLKHPLAIVALFLSFGYLAFLAFVSVPETGHHELFTKIGLFEKYETFFLPSDSGETFALFPVNTAVLSHLFLRAGSEIGIGFFGFLAYLSIGFSTYALSRRYAWPATAFTVTFITLSFPRLVFLSTTAGEEILPSAVSLFCILAIYRALEQPDVQDLILLVLGILFSISVDFLCLAFPIILFVLSCVLFIRRHGRVTWTSLLIKHWKILLFAIVPILVFSQVWLFAFNFFQYGGWLGNNVISPDIPLKDNVLIGALANMVRYLYEIIHLSLPLEMLFNWAFGFSFNGLLMKTYKFFFEPLFGNSGAAVPFVFSLMPNGQLSWFGPFGILFVIPSIVLALFRGHRRLKAIAVALAGYVYLVALVVVWRPGNAHFFTIVFTCGGFCVSFLMPPWRFTTAGKKCLQVFSILILIYVCVFNMEKPLVKLPESPGNISLIHSRDKYPRANLIESFFLPPIIGELHREYSCRFLSS